MRALRHASAVCRLAAALDAFLLKIIVEERLGYPVQLLSDGQLADIGPDLRISEGTSLNITDRIYSALARGEVDMHPEVTPADTMPYSLAGRATQPQVGARSDSQVWPSEDAEEYDVYVRRERSVTFFTALFVPLFRLSVP
jgi:hypothetical protein